MRNGGCDDTHKLFLRLDVVVEYLCRDVNELNSISFKAFVINDHAFLDLKEMERGDVANIEILKGEAILDCLLDLIVLTIILIKQSKLSVVKHEYHLTNLVLAQLEHV